MNTSRDVALDRLLSAIGYRFRQSGLFEAALRHPSTEGLAAPGSGEPPAAAFERLEFLGDRVLGLVIAQRLYHRYPDEPEGALTKRNAALVSGAMVARIAEDIRLGDCLAYGNGVPPRSGKERQVALSDGFEALVGAIFLDGGFEAVQPVILALWEPVIAEEPLPPQDAKTELQERVQAVGKPLPTYRVISSAGPSHAPVFEVSVSVDGLSDQRGVGRSKRIAETEAARAMLAALDVSPEFASLKTRGGPAAKRPVRANKPKRRSAISRSVVNPPGPK